MFVNLYSKEFQKDDTMTYTQGEGESERVLILSYSRVNAT